MIGQNISHYKILEKLGEGGMGVVYKAEDTKLDRIVALKFLAPELTRDPDAKARFAHEAKAAAALAHPNICTIHEIDEFKTQAFIAMECCEGETLKERIDRGPLPLEQAIDIARQIAHGLDKAHEHDIIHRDIKPANVFITTDGLVKIVDFGVAKLSGQTRMTREGVTLGTVAYMSPEQAQARAVDHRTDIWSTGVTLYEMVTGKLPFQADHEQATLHLILNEEPRSVNSHRSDLPKQLAGIIERCLNKDSGERYQNAGAMKRDLESLIASLKSGAVASKVPAKESQPSIAVLPFRDMSSMKDQDYFCEGIAEELINALVKLKGLRVAARTSAFQFKDRNSNIKKIGEELQVKTVLEGSIRKSGKHLRITAQLINVEDGFHIWSEKYDRDLDDIFAIQDEISLAIIDRLKVKLLGKERSALIKRHTEDQEAHNLYLKGLYFWNRRLEGGMKLAMEYFQQAIERDPGYALAHVGVADTYNLIGVFGYSPPSETFPRAKAAAHRALEIDDSLGEAHASLGFAAMFFDWNWPAAEREFKLAIELNPAYATAHEWYGLCLSAMGRLDEGIMETEKARDLDPLSLMINAIVGIAYAFSRQHHENVEHQKKVLEMDPNFLFANAYIALSLIETGRSDEAIEMMRRVEPLAAEHAYTLGAIGATYAFAGRRNEALRILGQLDELGRERYVSPIHRAYVYAGLGETDEMMDCLEKGYQERNPYIVFLNADPVFDRVRSNQRFQSLLKKIGL